MQFIMSPCGIWCFISVFDEKSMQHWETERKAQDKLVQLYTLFPEQVDVAQEEAEINTGQTAPWDKSSTAEAETHTHKKVFHFN